MSRRTPAQVNSMRAPGRRRALNGVTFCALLLVIAACSSFGAGESEPEIPQLDGSYTGTINIQGELLFGDLRIEQSEQGTLHLNFSFPDAGLDAAGEGRVSPSGFTAEVSYALTCPGEATLEGMQDPVDRTLSGSISASDCNGTLSGTFRFAPQR